MMRAAAGMERCVEAELLDTLPPEDPRAQHSRRDLRRVNAMMGNAKILARVLQCAYAQTGACEIAELGAGDGTLMLRIARYLGSAWRASRVTLVDSQGVVGRDTLEAFEALGWRAEIVVADVFDWLARREARIFDAVTVNLMLHHFDADPLRCLLSQVAQRTRYFAACEPRRSAFALGASRLLGLIGCNDVTRHDAPASVLAGFSRRELCALWPSGGDWRLEEYEKGLFSHCFVASSPSRGQARSHSHAL